MSRTMPARAVLAVAASLLFSLLAAPATDADAAETFAPRVVVAMGDSISRAAVADGTLSDNSRYSWSTGSVDSHVTRMAAIAGWTPPAYNVALGGTTTEDLVRQASSAVSRGADYVTILSGGNDVCQATSVQDLPSPESVAANVSAALQIINTGRPGARIFLASIPNIRALHAAGVETAGAPHVWSSAGICQIALAHPLDTSAAAEQRRATVEKRISVINAAIAEACAQASLCFDDDGAVFDMPIAASDLSSLDYFHPSIAGQAKIASVTWQKAVQKGVFAAAAPTPTYMDVIVDETSSSISWTGEWSSTRSPSDSGGSVAYIKAMKSGFSLTFTGTGVSVVARTTPSAGISEVRIDGALVGRVDSYSSATRHQQVIYTSDRLSNGTHRITVTATTDLNAASTGRNLILDALVVETVVP